MEQPRPLNSLEKLLEELKKGPLNNNPNDLAQNQRRILIGVAEYALNLGDNLPAMGFGVGRPRKPKIPDFLVGDDFQMCYERITENEDFDFQRWSPPQEHNSGDQDEMLMDRSRIQRAMMSGVHGERKRKEETKKDKVLQNVIKIISKGTWPRKVDEKLKQFNSIKDALSMVQECLMFGDRVVVPFSLQIAVLKQLHEGHPGMARMKQLARAFVYWPGLDDDVEKQTYLYNWVAHVMPIPDNDFIEKLKEFNCDGNMIPEMALNMNDVSKFFNLNPENKENLHSHAVRLINKYKLYKYVKQLDQYNNALPDPLVRVF